MVDTPNQSLLEATPVETPVQEDESSHPAEHSQADPSPKSRSQTKSLESEKPVWEDESSHLAEHSRADSSPKSLLQAESLESSSKKVSLQTEIARESSLIESRSLTPRSLTPKSDSCSIVIEMSEEPSQDGISRDLTSNVHLAPDIAAAAAPEIIPEIVVTSGENVPCEMELSTDHWSSSSGATTSQADAPMDTDTVNAQTLTISPCIDPKPDGATSPQTPTATPSPSGRRRRTASMAAILAIAAAASPPTPKTTRARKTKEVAVEDIYLNKLWKTQMPKERNWETIYEQPQVKRKRGSEIEEMVSAKRFKRSVDFDSQHTQARMKKRRQKALKRGWRPSSKKRKDQLEEALDARLEALAKDLESIDSMDTESVSSSIDLENDDVFYTPLKTTSEFRTLTDSTSNIQTCSQQSVSSCRKVIADVTEEVFQTPLRNPAVSVDTLNSSGESTDSSQTQTKTASSCSPTAAVSCDLQVVSHDSYVM